MMTVTYDASDGYLRGFIDGVEVKSCDLAQQGHPLGNNTHHSLEFGGQGGIRNFDGRMDEVAIWDRALNASEVADLYAGSYRTDEEVTYTSTYGSLAGVETSDGISTVHPPERHRDAPRQRRLPRW